eukprot:GHVH01006317.1.p1 GENE.GHVH01006317.1~~GHVH01006317.1.p1  ORF type:complete len:386 (-),score=44.64 GHVH01006317.1:888-1973(-)
MDCPFSENTPPCEPASHCSRVFTNNRLWTARNRFILIEAEAEESNVDRYKRLILSKPYNPAICLPDSPEVSVFTSPGHPPPPRELASIAYAKLALKQRYLVKERHNGGELLLVTHSSTSALTKHALSGPTALTRRHADPQGGSEWLIGMTDKLFTRSPACPQRYVAHACYRLAVSPPPPLGGAGGLEELKRFSRRLLYCSASSPVESIETFRALGSFFFWAPSSQRCTDPLDSCAMGFWFPMGFQLQREVMVEHVFTWIRDNHKTTKTPWFAVGGLLALVANLPLLPLLRPHLAALGYSRIEGWEPSVGVVLAAQICGRYLNGERRMELTRMNELSGAPHLGKAGPSASFPTLLHLGTGSS